MRNVMLFVLLSLNAADLQAGVVIGATRVVFEENRHSVTLSLRNQNDYAWLIHSKITSGGRWKGAEDHAASAVPFVITPPLFSLKPGRENALRIIPTHTELPRDRESLFTLSIATIPSGAMKSNSVQLAVRSRLKLFWRPGGLAGSPEKAYTHLRWLQSAGCLHIENPTPYYVTLFNLRINGAEIQNAGVVAPYSHRVFSGCTEGDRCVLQWQSLNDAGSIMPIQYKVLEMRER